MEHFLEAACASSIGKVRRNHEDNFYFNGTILEMENEGLAEPIADICAQKRSCYAVFDGMGGEEDGQIASFLAACSLRSWLDVNMAEEMTERNLEELAEHINSVVYEQAHKQGNNMGTTAAILAVDEDRIYLCNVGDSRIYRLRNERLIQISIDHLAARHSLYGLSRKPGLSQCIGMAPEDGTLEPYTAEGTALGQDVYLLCSDGLTDLVSDEQIHTILTSGESALVCVNALMSLALENGGRDNITVIVVQVHAEKIEKDL